MLKSLLLALLFCFGCSMTQQQFEGSHWNSELNGPIPVYTVTHLGVCQSKDLPTSGVFYSLTSLRYDQPIGDPAMKLRRLYVLGLDVDSAFYRSPDGGCVPPESEAISGVISPGFFIIHLDKPNSLADKYSFSKIEGPLHLPCPYFVSIYTKSSQ